MKIESNTVVSLKYRLTENDAAGTLIEEVQDEHPFVLLFGAGMIIPGFEENLLGLSEGDKFSFGVEHQDAYGAIDPEAVVELPVEIFIKDGKLDTEICKVGNIVPMRNDQGQQFNGTITKVGLEKVIMDFNHPLAGKNLYFSGSVSSVRQASKSELDHGHVH